MTKHSGKPKGWEVSFKNEFGDSSFTGGSFQWQCGRNLHHEILMLLHMYPGSTLASYKSLPKNAYRETSYINTGIKKNPHPPEQKIIQNWMKQFQFRCHFLWCFFPPRSFGVKLLERTETPKGEVWRPKLDLLGVFGATFGARTPASGMWRSSWHRTNLELQSGPVGPMDISSNQPFPTVDGWNLAPPGMYKTL